MTTDEEQAIEADQLELRKLIKSRDELTGRISEFANKLSARALTIEDSRFRADVLRDVRSARKKPKTMEDAVLAVMRESRGSWLTAPQIRGKLRESGFDLAKYSADLSYISTALSRLENKRNLRKRKRKNRRADYTWIEPRDADE
jgi:hypothetical protein